MTELLYLDTARLGRMSPGAAAAHRDFVALAGDEGGGLYFDRFLAGGLTACPAPFAARYPGLANWQSVTKLKADLRSVVAGCPDLPVLLASRSTALMKFAARLLFHPCRNVLTTDLDWPPYAAILAAEAERAGRSLTRVAVREAVFSGGLTEAEFVDLVCDRFARAGCDGIYLTAVSNRGVRLPVTQISQRLETEHAVRMVVVDGAQAIGHVGPALGAGFCDLYLAGCHKWLGGYYPLGIAFYGRERSRGRVENTMAHMMASGDLDDPLLRFSSRLEAGAPESTGETVNLAPLFSAQGAVGDAASVAGSLSTRLRNLLAASDIAAESGWRPLLPSPDLRSGILLVQAEGPASRDGNPDDLRATLRDAGVAATTYPGGLVRLSMPSADWRPGDLEHLRSALTLSA